MINTERSPVQHARCRQRLCLQPAPLGQVDQVGGADDRSWVGADDIDHVSPDGACAAGDSGGGAAGAPACAGGSRAGGDGTGVVGLGAIPVAGAGPRTGRISDVVAGDGQRHATAPHSAYGDVRQCNGGPLIWIHILGSPPVPLDVLPDDSLALPQDQGAFVGFTSTTLQDDSPLAAPAHVQHLAEACCHGSPSGMRLAASVEQEHQQHQQHDHMLPTYQQSKHSQSTRHQHRHQQVLASLPLLLVPADVAHEFQQLLGVMVQDMSSQHTQQSDIQARLAAGGHFVRQQGQMTDCPDIQQPLAIGHCSTAVPTVLPGTEGAGMAALWETNLHAVTDAVTLSVYHDTFLPMIMDLAYLLAEVQPLAGQAQPAADAPGATAAPESGLLPSPQQLHPNSADSNEELGFVASIASELLRFFTATQLPACYSLVQQAAAALLLLPVE